MSVCVLNLHLCTYVCEIKTGEIKYDLIVVIEVLFSPSIPQINAFVFANALQNLPSQTTLRHVDTCPRNHLEYEMRADLFNCSSFRKDYVEEHDSKYHCLPDQDRHLIEVCAPEKLIHGKKYISFLVP